MKRLIAALAILLVNSACGQQEAPADPSVIAAGAAAWEAAINAGDLDAVVELYTADARIMPPNLEMSSGRDAVRDGFSGLIEAGISIEITSIEAMVSGDLGYNVGTYVMRAGDEVVDTGKYMETWRLDRDGKWRVSNDIYNSDNPPAVPEKKGPMTPMTHVVISHEVEDAERWLAAWRGENSRHQLFRENGAKHVHTMQSTRDPNRTGLIVAVSDMNALNAMLGSEQGMEAAATDGVKLDTMVILNEAE